MLWFKCDGLTNVPGYKRAQVPIYLTDDFAIMEGPTVWIAHVAKRKSRSDETLDQYGSIMARYLLWLDRNGYRAEKWPFVDDSILRDFSLYLQNGSNPEMPPDGSSVNYYLGVIEGFYKWATDNGYGHCWQMKREKFSVSVDSGAMVSGKVEQERRELTVGSTCSQRHMRRELRCVVDNDSFVNWAKLLGKFDVVYMIIALMMRLTAMRPKELLQLPNVGTGKNADLQFYHGGILGNFEELTFHCASKARQRDIKMSAYLWAVLCIAWYPIRRKRAKAYKTQHGVYPPNALFITEDGTPITYRMLSDHFRRASNDKKSPRKGITCVTLRRSWATYCVIEALRIEKKLGGKGCELNAALADKLQRTLGHKHVQTTYNHYVHLANLLLTEDLMCDLKHSGDQDLLKSLTPEAVERLKG